MKVYFIFGILTIISQFGVGLAALRCGRIKEAAIAMLFGLANAIIYLWPNK